MPTTAELQLDGTLCARCAIYIDDATEGYSGACDVPRYCRGCGGQPGLNGQRDPGAVFALMSRMTDRRSRKS